MSPARRTGRVGRVGVGALATAMTAVLCVLAVGAVRSVRSELVLSEAWQAVEAADWARVRTLTEPMLLANDAGRRAAELHCYALLATGERDRCGEVLDAVLTGKPGYLPEPMLLRLAVAERQRSGHLQQALTLAREAAAAHPDDPLIIGLELSAHAALENEDLVLESFEHRLAAADGPGFALRLALARRYVQRAEWERALGALGDAVPPADALRAAWFEERVTALAALGRLAALQATMSRWREHGGDPAELEARYALALSLAQLPDPAASWVALLERALARGDAIADARLRRQLHERVIAHHLADADDDAALRAYGRAEEAGVELLGITREQIERGAALRDAGGDPSRVPEAELAFHIPAGVGAGVLLVSSHALAEPDAPYEAVTAAEGTTVELARRPARWPERWVLRDAAGRVRASGSVWPRAGMRGDIRIEARESGLRRDSRTRGVRAAADGRSRVFALVLDCADWRLVQYLRARGELPTLEDLLRRGHRAVLHSDPPLTAAAMESLVWPARGRATSVVGVVHQLGVELSGLASVGDNPFAFLAPLLPEGESLFERVGRGPHVAANMLFAHGGIEAGRHAEMIGPHGVRRRVQTARVRRPLGPEELRRFEGIADDPQAAGHVESIAAELDAAVELARGGEVDLLALRLESLDILTHALYSPLASTRQDDGRSNLLAAYRYIDARIAEVDAALDADDILVVMSDHGVRTAMEHEEDAIFVAVGAGVPVGRAAGRPDLRGVARTLAALAGVETSWPATGVAAWLEQGTSRLADAQGGR